MARVTLKSALVSGTLTLALLATAVPHVAHAAKPEARRAVHWKVGLNCQVLRVRLNGNQPATADCLVQIQPGGQPQPLLDHRDPCAATDLHLYINSGESGSDICFYNTGFTNLTDWPYYGVGNWNDITSSWEAGVWYGHFYVDTNGGTPSMTYGAHSVGDFTNTTPVRNDQLSSLTIDGQG